MAIRLLNAETSETISEHEFSVTILGKGQLITAFRRELGIGGYIHTGPPQEDFKQVIQVKHNEPVKLRLTQISEDEIIAEAF